jgi:hypothetical protein
VVAVQSPKEDLKPPPDRSVERIGILAQFFSTVVNEQQKRTAGLISQPRIEICIGWCIRSKILLLGLLYFFSAIPF